MAHKERPLLLSDKRLGEVLEELRRLTSHSGLVEDLAGHISAQDEEIRDLNKSVDVLKEHPLYYVDEVEAESHADVEALIEAIRNEVAKHTSVRRRDTVRGEDDSHR